MNKQMDFWNGKKVFVTGHTGFKGTWLSVWLNTMQAKVAGYSLAPPTCPSLFELTGLQTLVETTIADIRDLKQLKGAIYQFQPEILFHMAAQPLVRESYLTPVETYETNVMGTVNVLEAVRSCGSVKAVVIITTDKCYANQEWIWGYRENEPMGGYDPYSSSKACAELVVDGYRQSFFHPDNYSVHGVAVASARAGNVIGGGDWSSDRLIPDCIRALLDRKEIILRNPSAIRPWQHVLEPLNGYLLLAQKLVEEGCRYAGAYNFGPVDGDCAAVVEVVKMLCDSWGGDATYRVQNDSGPHEANILKLDCSKARHELNWVPRWRLEKAIDLVVEWSKAYQKQADIMAVCQNQISTFYGKQAV
ncbi:CDP-glucose 4,6-dehydratase [bacterium]|nr:CDP-glucose 4,6-dehydratase [bacterium]